MISLHAVSKAYDGKVIVHNLTTSFHKEKIHILLGPSGSGKTTILRLIMGLIEPDTGEIQINDTIVSRQKHRDIASQIGYVIQESGLFPHLSAKENVTLVAKLRGWKKESIQKRLEELLRLVNLDNDSIRRYPQELSGGQRKRVSLMRALMLDPPYLLLDEPLGALDPIIRSELQAELKRIFSVLKKTVILVTHDINEAALFGDTISLFHQGAIIQQGTFEELCIKPTTTFVTQFIDAQKPPQNIRKFL